MYDYAKGWSTCPECGFCCSSHEVTGFHDDTCTRPTMVELTEIRERAKDVGMESLYSSGKQPLDWGDAPARLRHYAEICKRENNSYHKNSNV